MMNDWVLGVAEVSRAVSRHAQRSSSLQHNWVLIATCLAIAILWVMLFAWDRRRRRAEIARNHASGLFHELCAAHKLSQAEQSLLERVVAEHQLPQPALVFLDRRLLAEGPETAPDGADRQLLATKLFVDFRP